MKPLLAAFLLSFSALLGGCSIKSMALNSVADALSSGGDVFSSDDDPELIRDAVPFGLKTYESILAEVPDHRGLLLTTAKGFTQYAYAFVLQEAERLDETDLARSRELKARARKLFLRGRDYAFRGLEVAHPDFVKKLRADPRAALAETTLDDCPLLYWAGVSTAAALSAAKDDVALIADLPLAGAMVSRVLELDEKFEDGGAHEFMVAFEGSRSDAMGGSVPRAREHYRRALELSKERPRVSLPLTLAESVCVREQNAKEFSALIDAALAVDPEAVPSQKLANTIFHRRALWLKTRMSDLFLDAAPEEKKQ
jgi:predicted anti-sigma-YlaC factor YlaD